MTRLRVEWGFFTVRVGDVRWQSQMLHCSEEGNGIFEGWVFPIGWWLSKGKWILLYFGKDQLYLQCGRNCLSFGLRHPWVQMPLSSSKTWDKLFILIMTSFVKWGWNFFLRELQISSAWCQAHSRYTLKYSSNSVALLGTKPSTSPCP